MSKNNYAVFIDLENTGGKAATLNSVIEKVKIKGDILIGRVYGYRESFSDLKEVLLSNTFSVLPSIRYGVNQKNNLDIQLVIDALDVAYTNDLIDCFCIVSGDSDYTPLVGKLKSMGKFVLGISRSEVASNIFIKACNEFIFLESVTTAVDKPAQDDDSYDDSYELMNLLEKIISDQADEDGTMFVSELKKTLLRLKPDFSEKSYGSSSFGRLLNTLENKYKRIHVFGDFNSLKVRLVSECKAPTAEITKANWLSILQEKLNKLKNNGFDRVNPSIIKSELQKDYPDFDEYRIGFKKFSDLMKRLEKENMVSIEFNEAKTMLIKIK
ncbi:MAG TPA: NYN domain-containing protein [Candidatus Atribacteria bacterium]|nr:NYN domain-containing protein [Candidatus Atribacteria bacterium]HPT79217.1 NYN domain-containing protein [Candidatus Atribacteria bacterium]